MSEVAVTLNGEPTTVGAGITIRELLDGLAVDPRRVVVEHNRRILRGTEIDGATVAAGDEIEVLRLVGGGA